MRSCRWLYDGKTSGYKASKLISIWEILLLNSSFLLSEGKNLTVWKCRSIFLNLTNICNVRCKKCITFRVIRKRGELSKDMLFSIFHLLQVHQFNGIVRCGLGENLIYSYLDDLINYVYENTVNYRIDLLTNGLAFPLDKESYYSNKKIRWGVTLDGMTQSDIQGLQSGLDVELVKKNLYQIKLKYPACNMYLNYTLTNKNLGHLPEFIRMAVELNIEQIYVTPLKIFKNHHTDFLSKYIPDLFLSSTMSIFSKIRDLADQNGIRLHLPGTFQAIPCSISGNYSPIIDIDGMVSFCSGQENIRIGNITDYNIAAIWEIGRAHV